jgi:hypothetical protein
MRAEYASCILLFFIKRNIIKTYYVDSWLYYLVKYAQYCDEKMASNLEYKFIFITEYEHGDARNLGGGVVMARVQDRAMKETRPNKYSSEFVYLQLSDRRLL